MSASSSWKTRVQLDLVMLVDAQAGVRLLRLERDRRAAVGVDARQELLVDLDAHLLHVGVGAARARPSQRRADAAAHEDAAVRALQAQVGVERSRELDVRAEADVAVAEPGVTDRAGRLAEEPGDVERDHGRVAARACSSGSTTIVPAG